MNEEVNVFGHVYGQIEHKDGTKVHFDFPNTILSKGRQALASSLAKNFTGDFDFYISRMLFGNGGTTEDGTKKYVNTSRNGLFGTLVASKPVMSSIDSDMPYQAIFTSVLRFDEANGLINEMALQMSNEQLYSMVTFPDLNKSDEMQITFNWRLSFV
jgi:hypothetical protein